MTQKYFNLIFQWAFFFYLIFFIQTAILFMYDANSFGTLNKWRFIQPTYISFTYVLLSILAFSIAYAFSYYVMKGFSSNKKYFPKSFTRRASLALKSLYFLVCLAYLFLGTFIFQDNYRLDNSFISMITMLPLNTLIWSIALILILLRNQSNNKNDILILVGIFSLFTNISGVGSFTIALALTILFFLSNNHLDFNRFLIFLIAGLLFIT